jgi:hypothetical protein
MDDDALESFLDFEIEPPAHPFAVDLRTTVLISWEFALNEINRVEEQDLKEREEELAGEDYEILSAGISAVTSEFERYRESANQLALVGVLTRLQHWINSLVDGRPDAPKGKKSLLVSQLKWLDAKWGPGPVPISFFEDAVTVRDSIVHGNSEAVWMRGTESRKIADRYSTASGQVSLSEVQLKEVASKAIEQFRWFEAACPPIA